MDLTAHTDCCGRANRRAGAMKPRRSLRLRLRLGVGAACLGLAVAAGAATPRGQQIADTSRGVGKPACISCHGPSGQGLADAGFPRLAGLPAAYLGRQLRSFDDGTRISPVMTPIAKGLSAADRLAVATYFASLPVTEVVVRSAAPAATPALIAAGAAIAQNGKWSAYVPACAQCHGAQGFGVGDTFPQIAGQSATYIANQLQAWRRGTRKDDPMGLMHGIALRLSEPDVNAVAAYYASLPATAETAPGAKP